MDPKSDEQTELLRLIWNEMKALGANLGTRIDATNARLDATGASLGARIDGTNARLDRTIATIDRRFDETNARLDSVDTVLRELAGQQVLLGRFVRSVVDGQIGELRDRLARVEAKLAG